MTAKPKTGLLGVASALALLAALFLLAACDEEEDELPENGGPLTEDQFQAIEQWFDDENFLDVPYDFADDVYCDWLEEDVDFPRSDEEVDISQSKSDICIVETEELSDELLGVVFRRTGETDLWALYAERVVGEDDWVVTEFNEVEDSDLPFERPVTITPFDPEVTGLPVPEELIAVIEEYLAGEGIDGETFVLTDPPLCENAESEPTEDRMCIARAVAISEEAAAVIVRATVTETAYEILLARTGGVWQVTAVGEAEEE